jgi:hypothetical protein
MLAAIIRAAIRAYILEKYALEVANDLATNGLTPADEAIVDAFLDAP